MGAEGVSGLGRGREGELMVRRGVLSTLILVCLVCPAAGQDEDDPFGTMFGEEDHSTSVEELPTDPRARGIVLLRQGRLDEAEASLRRAVEAAPDDREAQYWLARLFLLTGRGEQVQAQADRLIKLAPGEAYGYLLRAIRREQRGELKDARQDYGVAKTLTRDRGGPLKLEVLVRLGQLMGDTGEREAAGKTLEEALDYYQRRDQLTAAEFTWVARACRELDVYPAIKGSYQRRMIDYARRMLDQALLSDAGYVPAYVEAGTLSLQKFDTPGAKQSFTQAVDLDANDPEARVGLARTQLESWALGHQRFAIAAKNLQAALAIDPTHPGAHATLAAIAVTDGKYDEALERLANALEVRPGDVELLAVKAACLLLRGDQAGYEAVQAAVLEARPTCAAFFEQVAELVQLKFRYAEARDLARKALEVNPDYHPVLAILGVNLTRTGDEEEGRAVLQRAFDEDPYNVYTYNQLELFDRLEENYETVETEHFVLRLHKDEQASVPYVLGLLDEARARFVAKYGAIPDKVLIELFNDHSDFSARSVGLPGIPALGVCFGNVVTVLSAQEKKAVGAHSWGRTLWHEFAHVATLTRSKNRVPRWLTEGLSVYEESRGRASWAREYDVPIMTLMAHGMLLPIATLDAGFTKPTYGNQVMMSYYQGGITCEFIDARWGFSKLTALLDAFAAGNDTAGAIREVFELEPAAFDALFLAYLRDRYGRYAYTPPPSLDQRQAWLERVGAEPLDVAARGALAWAYALHGQQADAERHAGLALKHAEAALGPFALQTGEQSGLPGSAQLSAARMAALRTGAADAHLALGLVAARRQKGGRALRHLTHALNLGTRDPVLAHRLRSDIYRIRGDMPRAIESLETVVALMPPDADVHRMLMACWQQAGNTERAMAELKQACLLDSEDVQGRLKYATWAKQRERWADVREVMDDINMIDPFLAPAHLLLGDALRFTAGGPADHQRALREFDAALALQVDYRAGAHIGRASCLFELGRHQEAAAAVEAALTDDPDNAEAQQLDAKLDELGVEAPAAPAVEEDE